MVPALDPRNPRMQKRLELAGVQMAPRPLWSMIIHRKLRPAFRTRPPQIVRLAGP
jgi:hypothetical protein